MNTARWSLVNLGEVLRVDLDRVHIDPSTSYPMVGVYSFGRGLFHKEPVENGSTSYKYFNRLKPDHFIMSQLFGWEGALALSSEEFAGKFVSPQFPTFKCDSDRLNKEYLWWYVRRPEFWTELGSRTGGMGDRRRTLNPKALLASEIPLPPLEEQRRIVARIEELTGGIEEARELRRQADKELKALSMSLLASFGGMPKVPMAGLVHLRKPDIEVKAHEEYTFAGVYSFGRGVFKGQTKSGMDFSYKRLTKLKRRNFTYPKLMAWEGAFGMVPDECAGCYVSPEFPVFEVIEDRVFPEVIDTYFTSPGLWPQISGASTGTNVRRRRLNPKDFLQLNMPLPPRKIQEQIRQIRSEQSKVAKLSEDFQLETKALTFSILDHAFRGEL